MNPSIKHMWSLPGFRSAADAAKAPCELDPLERLPCDGLVLQLPARCPAAGRSEDVFQYTEEEVDTLQRWSEMRLELKFS